MTDLNQIIKSLTIQLKNINKVEVLKPFRITNFKPDHLYILFLKKGQLLVNNLPVYKNDTVIITGGESVSLQFGLEGNNIDIGNTFDVRNEDIFNLNPLRIENENVYVLEVGVDIYDSISFFNFLSKASIQIPSHHKLKELLEETYHEAFQELVGFEEVLSCNVQRVVIEIIRYLYINHELEEELNNNNQFLKDNRLMEIFGYIRDNIQSDLSNAAIANVASLSEDYVGQYFKSSTGMNLQDFVEKKRLEKAVELLQNTNAPIREIGNRVGFQDTAYFCKRFKMCFGKSANQLRKQLIVSKYVNK